jgi:hypothetical protein
VPPTYADLCIRVEADTGNWTSDLNADEQATVVAAADGKANKVVNYCKKLLKSMSKASATPSTAGSASPAPTATATKTKKPKPHPTKSKGPK